MSIFCDNGKLTAFSLRVVDATRSGHQKYSKISPYGYTPDAWLGYLFLIVFGISTREWISVLKRIFVVIYSLGSGPPYSAQQVSPVVANTDRLRCRGPRAHRVGCATVVELQRSLEQSLYDTVSRLRCLARNVLIALQARVHNISAYAACRRQFRDTRPVHSPSRRTI